MRARSVNSFGKFKNAYFSMTYTNKNQLFYHHKYVHDSNQRVESTQKNGGRHCR